MSVEFHRAAIAFHQAEIDKLTGVPAPSGFDPTNWRTWWPAMLEQFKNDERPHPWVDWAPGVLPDQVGNNVDPPPMYEGAKPFWAQMERQLPPVLDSRGVRFNALTCAKRGGWGDFEDEVRRLWNGPMGVAYRADPANAAIWPNIRV